MKKYCIIIISFFVFTALFADKAHADYQFDDMYGTSGKSYQWMILNPSDQTFGDTHQEAIDVSIDNNAVIEVLSGQSESEISSRELGTLFMTAANGQSDFTLNLRAPTLAGSSDIAAPYLELSTPWNRNATEADLYIATVSNLDTPSGQD